MAAKGGGRGKGAGKGASGGRSGSGDLDPYHWDSMKKMKYSRVFASPVIHDGNLYVIGGCDQMGQPVDSFECFDTKKKWQTLANLPTKRAAPAVAVVDDIILAIGGVGGGQQPVAAIEAYDVKAKAWKSFDPFPEGLLGLSCVVRDKKVYLMGGMGADTNPHDDFRVLDIETGQWKGLQPMLTPRYATFSFLIHDKLYVVGGRQGKLPCVAFEVYDFTTEKWTKLPDIPSKRVFAMYAATDTHIFSIGGLLTGNLGFSDACEVFNIEKNEWTIGSNLPTKRGDFAIGVVGPKVVCAGGLGNEGKPLNIVEAYDHETNTWTKLSDMPNTHCSCAYIVHNGKLHVIGGLATNGPTACMEICDYKNEKND